MSRLVVAALLLAQLVYPLYGKNCKLGPDLYKSRKTIEELYANEIGKDYAGHKLIADKLLDEKLDIDKQYFGYMLSVSQGVTDHNHDTVSTCCIPEQTDPIARQICTLGEYLQGRRKETAAFLAGVPTEKQSADALWVLDEIAHAREGQGTALPFGPNGPVNRYLSELFGLVVRGNKEAITKYLGLYGFADGEYAEAMEGQLETLFVDHTGVVLSNWRVIKGYSRPLSDLRESMSAEQKSEAAAHIEKKCVPAQECEEVLAYLR